MREYLDANDIANNAMMLGDSGKTIVIVEGVTDRRLYGKFLDPSVEVVIAHSKSNVKNSVKIVIKRKKGEFVIGIVDADLDYLKGSWIPPQLFITDARDSESMMLMSNAYEDVIAEYGEPQKVRSFERRFGNIRDAVTTAAYPLGLMMYISDRYGWKLSFKEMDFSRFVDRNSLSIDIRSFIRELSSMKMDVPDQELMNKLLREEMGIEQDRWHVCRGHDVMKILALGLRNSFGSFNCKNMTDSALSGAFRLAYDNDDFSVTKLYKDSKEWSERTGHVLWKVTLS